MPAEAPNAAHADGRPDTYSEQPAYLQYDRGPMPVAAMAADYLPTHVTKPHQHPHAQLIHAVHGVMVVSTSEGQWIVPPTRGMWMPGGTVMGASTVIVPTRRMTRCCAPSASATLSAPMSSSADETATVGV